MNKETKEKIIKKTKIVFHGYVIFILGLLSWFTVDLMYNHIIHFLSVDFIDMIYKIPEEYQFIVWAFIGVQVLGACINILKFSINKIGEIINSYRDEKKGE